MGFMIVIGGSIGTALGIYTFTYFKDIGKIDSNFISLYVYTCNNWYLNVGRKLRRN